MLELSRQEAYRRRYAAMRPGYLHGLHVYLDLIDGRVGDGTRLLDIGCGPGGLVKRFEDKAFVVGADRYAAWFDAPAEIRRIVTAENAALPFPDACFDLVTCSWVLEHLEAPEAVFTEAARVLKPGGHFAFITPNRNNYVVLLRRLMPNALGRRATRAIYRRDEDFINPTYYRANSRRAIDAGLGAAGLRAVRFEAVGDPTYLAFNEPLFRLSTLVERAIDRFAPNTRVHLVGLYQKAQS